MAVARDTIAHGSVNGGDSFNITLSTGGSNELILVGVHNSNSGVTATTPTSTNLTFVQVGTTETMGTNGTFQVYRAFAASALTSEVITVSATPTGHFPQMTGIAVSYSGTDTTGTNGSGAIDVSGNVSSASANGESKAVTTVTNNALGIAFAGATNVHTITAGAGQTLVEQDNNTGNFSSIGLIQQNAVTTPAGSVTMSYTLGGSTDPCAINAIGIKPPSSTAYTQAVTGAVSFVGSGTKASALPLTAALSFAGGTRKATTYVLTAALSFSGSVSRAIKHVLTAAVSFAGSITRNIAHVLTAALNFVGATTRATAYVLSGALSFSGGFAAGHIHYLTFLAVMSFSNSVWYGGANSTNVSNNTGWDFSA